MMNPGNGRVKLPIGGPRVFAVLAAIGFMPTSAQAQLIEEYEYQPDRIYQVRAGLGITTQIELGPEEKILDYSTGFSSGWDLTRRGNVFYLKPKNIDVDTNMLVRTETHAYIFELKVVATDWVALEQARQAGVQYKVAFRYPNEARSRALGRTDTQDHADPVVGRDRRYHFDYDYAIRKAEPWLVPDSAYDDGSFTYLRLSLAGLPSGDFPAIFGREEPGGDDFVVNTSVEDHTLIVHGTYPYLVLRHGDDTVLIRRNGFTRQRRSTAR
jgi:type IV secretion system protein VirB9